MWAVTLWINARGHFPRSLTTLAEDGGNNHEVDINAVLAWGIRECFTYKSGHKSRTITVQCKLWLPSTKLLSVSKDSMSDLKKHLEVSWLIGINGQGNYNPVLQVESAQIWGQRGGSTSLHVACPTLVFIFTRALSMKYWRLSGCSLDVQSRESCSFLIHCNILLSEVKKH